MVYICIVALLGSVSSRSLQVRIALAMLLSVPVAAVLVVTLALCAIAVPFPALLPPSVNEANVDFECLVRNGLTKNSYRLQGHWDFLRTKDDTHSHIVLHGDAQSNLSGELFVLVGVR